MFYIRISGFPNIVKIEPWSSATYDILNWEVLMKDRTAGFVGGGRVARIILGGLKKTGSMPRMLSGRCTDRSWTLYIRS